MTPVKLSILKPMKLISTLFWVLCCFSVQAQPLSTLPLWNKQQTTVNVDWLIAKPEAKANIYQTEDGKLVFSNGLVVRTFALKPNGATVGLELLRNNESFLRSVRPEAEIEIEGLKFSIGGLTGQPIHNYLLPEWLANMKADPSSFKLIDYSLRDIKARFPWKKRSEWMPHDLPWPLPGKELIFRYRLDDTAIRLLAEKAKIQGKGSFDYLKAIVAEVHYEMYDGMPVFSKWIRVINESAREIKINTFKSEILAVTEPDSEVDSKKKWDLPNITVESDYNFGGMSNESLFHSSIAWNIDTLYKTQVSYERTTPCLLEAYPKYGPDQTVKAGQSFESYRIWELIHESWDRERKSLEHRRMFIFPDSFG